jgi:Na+/proline symporter
LQTLDWIILVATVASIVLYGTYLGRKNKTNEQFLVGNRTTPWWSICLGVMATQASAVTFLSVPGKAYTDGLSFIQFYFGLPLAMVVIAVSFVPVFHKLKLLTAYQFLETRFDLKTRTLGALLFLIPRGLSTGISLAAPSIILSAILGWDIRLATLLCGTIVCVYCVMGGSKAVSSTQNHQMLVVLLGLGFTAFFMLKLLPISLNQSVAISNKLGKMNAIDWSFDLKNEYNVWSGLIGGFFLQLSYFGTDQSQVGRYLGGVSVKETRLGLLMNGLLKIPVQLFILFLGILMLVFYQYHAPPLNANRSIEEKILASPYAGQYKALQEKYKATFEEKKQLLIQNSQNFTLEAAALDKKMLAIKKTSESLLENKLRVSKTKDVNYVFLDFVMRYLPRGLVGFLLAMILLASMGSVSAAFNALSSSSCVDIYQRLLEPQATEAQQLAFSKKATVFWCMFCMGVALFSFQVSSLVELVNVLGSWFYGTILGIFLVAFYVKSIKGTAVFWAAIIAEIVVIAVYQLDIMAYLWLNVIGCLLVIALGFLLQKTIFANSSHTP